MAIIDNVKLRTAREERCLTQEQLAEKGIQQAVMIHRVFKIASAQSIPSTAADMMPPA